MVARAVEKPQFFSHRGMESEPEPYRGVQGDRHQHVRRLLGRSRSDQPGDVRRAGNGADPDAEFVGLTSPQNRAIIGWNQVDEPDNAQPMGGRLRSMPDPGQIVVSYNAIRAKDTTRPVELGLGEAWPTQLGADAACPGQTTSYYPLAVAGGDIISFDITRSPTTVARLELVANGVDNLKTWIAMSGTSKIIWNVD